MKAEKSHVLPSVSWRPRKAGGTVSVPIWRPENWGADDVKSRSESKDQRTKSISVREQEKMPVKQRLNLSFFHLFFFLYSKFFLVINFIHISVYMSVPIAQFSTPPSPPHPRGFPPLVSIHLFSTSVSQLLSCKLVHLYHFSRFHIHVLIYDICFSLSDLLHSVWQSVDPSKSQQMTQFRSFLWLSNIPLYICTTSSLSIRLSMGI